MHFGSLTQLDRLSLARAPGWLQLAAKPLAISLFAAGLLWPLAWLILNGVTPFGQYEESLGYRYFYTLRQLHESSTYLFLPQGQSTDLIFKLVQIALDAIGIPPTQLHPRINYFYVGSVAIFQLINIVAFAWMLRQAPRRLNPFLVAVFWLLPFYAPQAAASNILLIPDYLAVEPAIAMLCAALMIRAYRFPDQTLAHSLRLGILLGVVLATKITLAVFPGVTLLYLALSTRPLKRSAVHAAAAALTGFVLWMLIMLVDQSFGIERLVHQLRDLEGFVRSGSSLGRTDQPWLAWMRTRAGQTLLISALIYLTPFIALATLVLARSRKQLFFLASLLAGALAYSYALYHRDYPVTLLESGFYTFLLLWCVWCVSGQPALEAWWDRVSPPLRLLSGGAIAVVLTFLMVDFAQAFAISNIAPLAAASRTEQQFERLTQQIVGRRLWLVPGNDGRPLSIESAIMKGGSGLTGIWLQPDSALMRRIVPDLDFRFERSDQRPVNLDDYTAVFFVTKTDLETRKRVLDQRYHIDLFQLNCRELIGMQTGTVAMCVGKKGAAPS